MLYGELEPGGRLPQTFPVDEKQASFNPADYPGVNGKATYSEGLLVGYRWYDAKRQRPLFPFGYGLGYTSFGYSHVKVHRGRHHKAVVTFEVRNTGSRRGSAVPQVYVSFPRKAHEPPKQLKGFRKVQAEWDHGSTARTTPTGSPPPEQRVHPRGTNRLGVHRRPLDVRRRTPLRAQRLRPSGPGGPARRRRRS